MQIFQKGIADPVPAAGRYLYFDLRFAADVRTGLKNLQTIADGEHIIVGIGHSLLSALDRELTAMPVFPALSQHGLDIPSTPAALWCWLRGDDRGELLHLSRKVIAAVSGSFQLLTCIDAFRYGIGRDLTGYEDGTENPQDEEAIEAAFVHDDSALHGSSFVAVQKWQHNLEAFDAMPQAQRDNTIGRRLSDNEELEDAPESAHVKRTAQESFSPEAFMLRRSMPWADACVQGLVFVAFANSVYPFAAQMQRMIGAEDGIRDALFQFTRPVSGNYFWCPPMQGGKLDLQFLGV